MNRKQYRKMNKYTDTNAGNDTAPVTSIECPHTSAVQDFYGIIQWMFLLQRERYSAEVIGNSGRGHHTENAAGAVKGTDGLRICGKEIL